LGFRALSFVCVEFCAVYLPRFSNIYRRKKSPHIAFGFVWGSFSAGLVCGKCVGHLDGFADNALVLVFFVVAFFAIGFWDLPVGDFYSGGGFDVARIFDNSADRFSTVTICETYVGTREYKCIGVVSS
jgi:hypothetical protein